MMQEHTEYTYIKLIEFLKKSLVEEGIITNEKLRNAEKKAQAEKSSLVKALLQLGYVAKEQLARYIGEKMRIPYVDINNYVIDRKVLELLPEKIARRYNIIPLFRVQNILTVAMSDPLNIATIDEIAALSECKIEPLIASDENVRKAIDQWYGLGEARQQLIEELIVEFEESPEKQTIDKYKKITEVGLRIEAEEPTVIKLVNSYIVQSMLEGASDIHFEPRRDSMIVRYRIDGLLYNRHQIPVKLTAPVIARIKIMAELDISKKRTPQDGRFSLAIRDNDIDVRTSTYPSMYGENVVLRILDKKSGILSPSDIGLLKDDLITFKKLISATKGIILFTGPTGSGKTTTIYSAINVLNTSVKNIMTVEDPIEYEIEGVIQSKVDSNTGVTFTNALRSIMRQDPDIIYIGEIRDSDTAEIAVRAALTGHLVLSTLHANDAVGAIVRLRDLGIGPRLTASVLNCVFAQRLVRKICPECAKKVDPDIELLNKIGLPPQSKLFEPVGCYNCNDIGYRGRTGIFEIMIVTKDIEKLISRNAPEDEIFDTAKRQCMKTLYEDGLRKVAEGITTLEELERTLDAKTAT